MAQNPVNQDSIRQAQIDAQAAEANLINMQAAHQANPTEENQARVTEAETALQGLQDTIGRLQNIGEVTYNNQHNRKWTTRLSMSLSGRTANRERDQELTERWRRDGQGRPRGSVDRIDIIRV